MQITLKKELMIPVREKTAICLSRLKGANKRIAKQIPVETRESVRPERRKLLMWLPDLRLRFPFQLIK